jgi:hypothetical protein
VISINILLQPCAATNGNSSLGSSRHCRITVNLLHHDVAAALSPFRWYKYPQTLPIGGGSAKCHLAMIRPAWSWRDLLRFSLAHGPDQSSDYKARPVRLYDELVFNVLLKLFERLCI